MLAKYKARALSGSRGAEFGALAILSLVKDVEILLQVAGGGPGRLALRREVEDVARVREVAIFPKSIPDAVWEARFAGVEKESGRLRPIDAGSTCSAIFRRLGGETECDTAMGRPVECEGKATLSVGE